MYKYLLLIVTIFFLTGCAQIGGIEGGPVDKTAPYPVPNGMQPPNGTLRFSTNKIAIKFNEFIRLNNPSQTISIIPDEVKVSAEVKGKTLTLHLDGELQENTTYTITMNGTVKDITEQNDSLMQYVFSTGDYLDSLTYTGFVINAQTLQPVNNCFVGLYAPSDSAIYKKPKYYASTNAQGLFTFNFLKADEYALYAFEDENKDSKWQKTEAVAFIDQTIHVDTAQNDTLQLKLFPPEKATKLTARYTYPAKFFISSTNPIDLKSISIENEVISNEAIHWLKADSLFFIKELGEEKQIRIAVQHIEKDTLRTDSLRVRIPSNQRNLKPSFSLLNTKNSYENGDSLLFDFSDLITAVDTSKIELLIYDTLSVPFAYSIDKQSFVLHLKALKGKKFDLNVLDGAFQFKNHQGDFSFTRQFPITDLEELGTLTLLLGQLPDNSVVEMFFNSKIYRKIILSEEGKKVKIEQLKPGTYTFKAFIDEDKNGYWTTGSFEEKRQAEEVLLFPEGVQVRSNWDIEAELEPILPNQEEVENSEEENESDE